VDIVKIDPMSTKAKFSDKALLLSLENGAIELRGRFVYGSNYTFLVNVSHAGQDLPAVYKPMRGEQLLWDFPEASLAGREVAAYLVSQALGFGFVPLTILRDGPYGPGSLQQYIDHNPALHYFTFKPADRLRLRPVALFDLLVNNADRKGGHILLQKRTRKVFLIDHGLCFHAEDKLRTVIWDFSGEHLPPELISALEKFRSALHSGLSAALQEYLTLEELAALNARLEILLSSRIFPQPPEDRRPFPYPPV
jgi:uncharacterized repeat protein (TIGR03843 family)